MVCRIGGIGVVDVMLLESTLVRLMMRGVMVRVQIFRRISGGS